MVLTPWGPNTISLQIRHHLWKSPKFLGLLITGTMGPRCASRFRKIISRNNFFKQKWTHSLPPQHQERTYVKRNGIYVFREKMSSCSGDPKLPSPLNSEGSALKAVSSPCPLSVEPTLYLWLLHPEFPVHRNMGLLAPKESSGCSLMARTLSSLWVLKLSWDV